jgi:hypothetical protein
MPVPYTWRKALHTFGRGMRDFVLTMLIVGGLQILASLVAWLLIFRSHPLGFSMALSLVGFASWLVALFASMGARRRALSALSPVQKTPALSVPYPFADSLQTQVDRLGCGFVLIVSSLIPLGIAFALRVRADMEAGLTWSDIFPPLPSP